MITTIYPFEVPLHNRDGLPTKLVQWKENLYYLDTEYPCNVTHNDEDGILAIDPSGGPYMSVSTKVTNCLRVKSMYFDSGLMRIIIALEFYEYGKE